jgi:hypothetical protein
VTTASTVRSRTLAAIPGYTEAARRSGNARARIRLKNDGLQFETAYAALVTKVQSLVDDDQDVPLNIADAAAQAERDDRSRTLRAQVLSSIAGPIAGNRASTEQYLVSGAQEATKHLASELAALVTEVKSLAPDLVGIRNAAEAIKAGPRAVAAWQSLDAHVTTYNDIRQTQWEILAANISTPTGDVIGRIALFAESLDVLPYWVNRRMDAAAKSRTDTQEQREYQTWLRSAKSAWPQSEHAWWPTADQEHHLVHICTKLHPWIPTPAVFDKALSLATRATVSVLQDIPTQQEVARKAYYDLVSAKPNVDTTPHVAGMKQSATAAKMDKRLERLAANAAAQRAHNETSRIGSEL